MGYRSYKNPPDKVPLRTVTGRGNDPNHKQEQQGWGLRFGVVEEWCTKAVQDTQYAIPAGVGVLLLGSPAVHGGDKGIACGSWRTP